MPIDAYSLCPGGTGKKIKFCCPDFLPELEKIDRMLDGDQVVACLEHIARLEQQPANASRACLMAVKGLLLRTTGQTEQALSHARAFVEKHPGNSIALSELAIMLALGEGDVLPAAMEALQQAVEATEDGNASERLYEAFGILAQTAIHDGYWACARALLEMQAHMSGEHDEGPINALVELSRAADIPLLLKTEPPLAQLPEDSPWHAPLEAALAPLSKGRWGMAERALTDLAERAGNEPGLWQTLARIRGWLADEEGAIAALRRYAALGVPLEDAVEAETLALVLADNGFEDDIELKRISWTVRDAEKLQESLLSDRRAVQLRVDGFEPTNDQPPPRAAFYLLDRLPVEAREGLTSDDLPRLLGEVLLFGKQTDREARFESPNVPPDDIDRFEALVREIGGEAIEPEPTREPSRHVSATFFLLAQRLHLPPGLTGEQVRTISEQSLRRGVLDRWPTLKLGVLGDRSLSEAVADPSLRVKALAAVALLELQMPPLQFDFDFNDLRRKLGLPTLDPIDLADDSAKEVPLVRLRRIMVEKLSDEELIEGFSRALTFQAEAAMRHFAREVAARPSLEGKAPGMVACQVLGRSSRDRREALGWIDRGRKTAEALGQSSAHWDLLEMSNRMALGQTDEALRVLRHVQTRHINEPGVAEALTQFLIEIGALNPDGTPSERLTQRGEAAPPPAEPGQLWTPEGASGGAGGGGKLWTPD